MAAAGVVVDIKHHFINMKSYLYSTKVKALLK